MDQLLRRWHTAAQFVEEVEQESDFVLGLGALSHFVAHKHRAQVTIWMGRYYRPSHPLGPSVVARWPFQARIRAERKRRQFAGTARPQYRQLTNFAGSATSPALSPDGRMLAFIRGPSAFLRPGQTYVKLLPDGEPVQLTNDDFPKFGPTFSPDGG